MLAGYVVICAHFINILDKIGNPFNILNWRMLAGYVVICAHFINISDINQIFNKHIID